MKAAQLKGKTIRKVHQRFWSAEERSRDGDWIITAIEFTDGSVLRFTVLEGEGEYGIEGTYPARDIEPPPEKEK